MAGLVRGFPHIAVRPDRPPTVLPLSRGHRTRESSTYRNVDAVAVGYSGELGGLCDWLNVHRLDRRLLPMRLQSMSFIQKEGPRWDALSRDVDVLFERYSSGGVVEHRYLTRVFVSISRPAVRQ